MGFGQIVRQTTLDEVFHTIYEKCLHEKEWLEAKGNNALRKFEFAHFSDTFLIYTPNDTLNSLAAIQWASKSFFETMLSHQIPLRGAMTCDEFYADRSNDVFLGKALVEAHEFGEKFNWIGFVLSPSATCRMTELGFPATNGDNSNDYKQWDAPTKRDKELVMAHFLNTNTAFGTQTLEQILMSMAAKTSNPEVQQKYDNTLRFLRHFSSAQPPKA